jgi:hypothetical protein
VRGLVRSQAAFGLFEWQPSCINLDQVTQDQHGPGAAVKHQQSLTMTRMDEGQCKSMAFLEAKQPQGFELAYLPGRHVSSLIRSKVLDPPAQTPSWRRLLLQEERELSLRSQTWAQPDDRFAKMNIGIVANDIPASGWGVLASPSASPPARFSS